MSNELTLSPVVPVLNKAESISPFISRIQSILIQQADIQPEIIFINNGTGQTLEILLKKQADYSTIKALNLSRDYDKEAVMISGLEQSKEVDLLLLMLIAVRL